MACDATTLTDASKCLAQGMSTHQLYAAWAFLVCSGGPTPPSEGITTEPDGAIITTDDGTIILPEP